MRGRCSLSTLSASVFLGSLSFAQIPYEYQDVCSPVYRFGGRPLEREFGRRLENIGDVDHDGVDDLLISIRGSQLGHRASGAVRVYSLASGRELYSVRGQSYLQQFGALGTGGDANADGTPDWIATDYFRQVHVHSGVDGSRLLTWSFPAEATSAAIIGDVNGDGHGDVLVGCPLESSTQLGAGVAHLLSGRDGTTLRTHRGQREYSQLGFGVVGIDDRDGDGITDYAISALKEGPDRKGAV